MSEHRDTHETHLGFGDHHHVAPKPNTTPLDPNRRASRETLDTVWGLIQGDLTPPTEAPPMPGEMVVEVPAEYVGGIAWCALRELKRRGETRGFSVARCSDSPEVSIAYEQERSLILPGPPKRWEQRTDCLRAWLQQRPIEHVAEEAVRVFLGRLKAALAAGGN